MADFKRIQIIAAPPNALMRDKVVNTIYLRKSGVADPFADDNLFNDLGAIMATKGSLYAGCSSYELRMYDMEDAPGPPEKIKTGAMTQVTLQSPREVALCLSFRGALNVPRQRGRIFLGPLNATSERPAVATRNLVLQFATDLANLGGTDVDWCVYSPTSRLEGASLGDSFHPVKHAWVDDEWDTVRSRGLRATTRTTADFNE